MNLVITVPGVTMALNDARLSARTMLTQEFGMFSSKLPWLLKIPNHRYGSDNVIQNVPRRSAESSWHIETKNKQLTICWSWSTSLISSYLLTSGFKFAFAKAMPSSFVNICPFALLSSKDALLCSVVAKESTILLRLIGGAGGALSSDWLFFLLTTDDT